MLTLNYTGQRITDAIQGALSTSLAAYTAAPNDAIVPITAAEYANLMTIAGATKYGTTDATLATVPPNGAGAYGDRTQSYLPGAFNGTYWASNSYMIGFTHTTKNTSTANNMNGLKIKFGANSYTALTTYHTLSTSVPLTPNTKFYYVIKRPTTPSPANARFALYVPGVGGGNINDAIAGGPNVATNQIYISTGDVNNPQTLSSVYGPAHIQGIMTSTKQW